MPYYEIDAETVEEFGGPKGAGHKYYEAASATYKFGKPTTFMTRVRDALAEHGIDEIRVKYDGGFDEGFSHFDRAVAGGKQFDKEKLASLLKDSPLASDDKLLYAEYPPSARKELLAQAKKMPVKKRIGEILEQFASNLASKLLGEGYGTGEMSLHGEFRAELKSGRIIDLEKKKRK